MSEFSQIDPPPKRSYAQVKILTVDESVIVFKSIHSHILKTSTTQCHHSTSK